MKTTKRTSGRGHTRTAIMGWTLIAGIGAATAASSCSPADPKGASSGGTGGYGFGAGGGGGLANHGGALGAEAGGPNIGDIGSGGAAVPLYAGGAPGSGGAAPVPPPSDQPIIMEENPGNLDPTTVTQLQQGGGGGPRILYPYDNTVFPVGLPPPVFQWENTAADAVYVHLKSTLFEYKGYFGAAANPRQVIPTNVWIVAGQQSKGATDPLSVEITLKTGGNVVGPIKETLIFALGKLKGDLFYNTYTSPQANNNGAVMKLRLGEEKPTVQLTDTGIAPLGPCWSCHSLSANGNVLVAQHHQYPGGPYSSASFDLKGNPAGQPPCGNPITGNCTTTALLDSATAEMGMGAVYPDGTKVLTMGSPGDSTLNPVFPDAVGNVPAMIGPKDTMLLDAKTGAPIPLTGSKVQYAKMPMFSPDGTMVVFNWHEDGQGHSLAVANFDNAKNELSNVHTIYKNDTLYPGWPFFTPDNKEVVFVLGNKADFVSGYPGRLDIAVSDLYTVDVASGKARQLARANGYPKDGAATYLPQPGRDEHLEFFPTVMPVAAGGYFWVFFTSRRTYGNIMQNPAADAPIKKIWVSAFNIRTDGIIEDPSNPPFYLPGQEDASGNIRAFSALEPCHADGGDCETGVDCCGGHCYQNKCQLPPPPPPPPPGEPPPPPACSHIDEKCNVAEDCCDSATDKKVRCVGNFCQIVAPPR